MLLLRAVAHPFQKLEPQVKLRVPTVIPATFDLALGSIWLGLRHLMEIQRVLRLLLGLALPPFMRELQVARRRISHDILVDQLVCFVGKGFPFRFHVIKFPGHGGGAGGTYVRTYPNNRLLENA